MEGTEERSASIILAHHGITVPEDEPVDNFLRHYGVLGMKWGVRKDRSRRIGGSDPSITRKKNRTSQPGETVVNNKGVVVDVPAGTRVSRRAPASVKANYNKLYAQKVPLSDAELKSRIDRLQMEKRFAELTKVEKSAGRKFVESALRDAGKKLAKEFIEEAITKENTAAFLAMLTKKTG